MVLTKEKGAVKGGAAGGPGGWPGSSNTPSLVQKAIWTRIWPFHSQSAFVLCTVPFALPAPKTPEHMRVSEAPHVRLYVCIHLDIYTSCEHFFEWAWVKCVRLSICWYMHACMRLFVHANWHSFTLGSLNMGHKALRQSSVLHCIPLHFLGCVTDCCSEV